MTEPMPPEPHAEAGPTEDDEEQILANLGYVLNPATGIYEDPDGDL